jgi:hypothetical protein
VYKFGPSEQCPCGGGLKYTKCHGATSFRESGGGGGGGVVRGCDGCGREEDRKWR